MSVETRAIADACKVGTVWYTSWGYDQTNVEFFEVVRETAASIVLRRIGAEVRDGRLYPRPGVWCVDFGLEGNSGTPTWERDRARGYSEKMCRKPRIYRDGYQSRGVTISDCRTAWPYEGGGQYDTIAAGQPGH
jgi:hypothetical protein